VISRPMLPVAPTRAIFMGQGPLWEEGQHMRLKADEKPRITA